MVIIIPSQLRRDEFRFVLVRGGQKIPFEKEWNSKNNYPFDDDKLLHWLEKSKGNYGVCCGYGDLVVVDSDDPVIARRAEEGLGVTFRALSGSGRGFHDYYTVPGMQRGLIFEREGKHLGEARFIAQMVVGPGSTHPSGGLYRIVNDEAIRSITVEDLNAAFHEFMKPLRTYAFPKGELTKNRGAGLQSLPLTVVLHEFDGHWRGRFIHGKNPFHGAKTGSNFTIDTIANLWRCWRCDCTAGVARAIALKHGLLRHCDEVLTREQYFQVVELAKQKYGFK